MIETLGGDPTIVRPKLSSQVARVIRDYVLTGRLIPGDRIVQLDWADRLGVSRMPVRDAINQLVAEGTLVQTTSGSTEVAQVDARDVRDGYELNAIISSLTARRAAEVITADQLDDIEKTHVAIEQAVTAGDRERAQSLNWQFHRLITNAAGSARLTALLRLLAPSIPHSAFELLDDWPARAVTDHANILEALRTGDADRAARLMHDHVAAGSAGMLSSLHDRLARVEQSANQSKAPD